MNAGQAAVAAWAIEALIASTLLMALVMVLRAPVRRVFGAQIAYALWALPILRLLLPPLPEAWREAAATPITRASETITMIVVPAAASPVAATTPAGLSVAALLAGAWIFGVALFLGWHCVRHARFCRKILATSATIEKIDRVRIVESAAAPGPLAFGIVRPCVAFPRDFTERYDADERALALAHELGHHARGDLIANWAALVVLGLHWFNPIAWRALHAFRADQELANDARVLAGRAIWERHAYACAIVKAAHGGVVSAACHLHSVRNLKGRLKMLTISPTSRRRVATGAASIVALAALGLGMTASGTRATAAIASTVGDTIGVDLPQTPPVAPILVAPVAPLPPIAALAPVAPLAPQASDLSEMAPVPPVPPIAPLAPVPPLPGERVTTTSDGRTVTTTTERAVEDGRVVRNVRRVVIRGKDGKVHTDTDHGDGAFRAIRDMPQVTSTNCDSDGAGRLSGDTMVVHKVRNGKKLIVICTDRIERAASASAAAAATAAVDAASIRKYAMAGAMTGLRSARASIAAMRHLSEAERREALAGIDESIAEMRAEGIAID